MGLKTLQYEMVIIFLTIDDIIFFESYNDVKAWEDFFFLWRKKIIPASFPAFVTFPRPFRYYRPDLATKPITGPMTLVDSFQTLLSYTNFGK